VFTGEYDEAETAYLALIKAGVKGAASHYSLLLNYEARYQEAVAQAEKGAADQPDSASFARLCRALDWSENLPAAVAAGARAVAARPVDPLAHAFYAEALTDSGRFEEAAKELRAADKSANDPYSRAEAYRGWSNYHRQRLNSAEELNYLQLAQRTQPGFPERSLELARFQYVSKRPDTAKGLIRQVIKAKPKSYRVQMAAGDSAWNGRDAETAIIAYQTAERLQRDAAPAALALAEIDVASRRDFKSAHDRLLAALKKDPEQSDVYQFLRYLDLLVLKTDPAAELNPIAPQVPAKLAENRKRAMDRLNAPRIAAGLTAIKDDPAMGEAAQAHAHYFMFNLLSPQVSGLGIHTEDPNLPGFVGHNGLLRARYFGYTGSRGSEVINNVFTPEASVQTWLDSVFHRFPIMDRETRVAGYGEAKVGLLSISVVDFGLGPPAKGEPVVFPADHARDVPAGFMDNELPDPLPQGTQPPTGYPITLQVGGSSVLTNVSGHLTGSDGSEVPGYALNPGQELSPGEWAFLASSPLKPGGTYSVDVKGQLDGKAFSKRWSFTVAPPAV
jgi:uncharacterized protein YkwD